jgi:copper chaperone CopZ
MVRQHQHPHKIEEGPCSMTAERQTETRTPRRLACPWCGKKAKRVSPVTLRALLKEEFAKPLAAGGRSCESHGEGCKPIPGDTGWRFCESPDCDVVYFWEEGDTRFTKWQLKVPVGVKETSGERPLCYCFGHSIASIKEELRTKGRSDALEDIRAKMKHPGCRCETENPSGACCLGSVARGIQIALEELGKSIAPTERVATTHGVPPAAAASRPPSHRGARVAGIGTLVSAIMASACCWLPLVLLAVGVSGAGIAATLEAYRPLFIVVTFGFLAAAFYFTYRPKKPAVAAGHGCCATDPAGGEACCAPTGKRRFSMMALNKVMLWFVTVLAVAFLFFPGYVGLLLATGNDAAVTENMNRAVFQIEGMTCEGCAATVAQAIRQVPGVLAVEVSYEKKQAVVGVTPGHPIPREKILVALKTGGYSATLVEAIPPAASSAWLAMPPAACCALPQPDERNGEAAPVAMNGPGTSAAEPAARSALPIDGTNPERCSWHVVHGTSPRQAETWHLRRCMRKVPLGQYWFGICDWQGYVVRSET